MNPFRHLSAVPRWALLPVLAVQGLRVRRSIPRLPEADHLTGVVPAGRPGLRLLVVGDSLAAGVGVGSHTDSVAGRLADQLAGRLGEPVAWQVVARTGATAAGVAERLLPDHPDDEHPDDAGPRDRPDAVVVLVGVNDLLRWNGLSSWGRDLEHLISAIRTGTGGEVPLVFCGMPPIARFPALPQPLRWVMATRAAAMDDVLAEVAERAHVGHLRIPAGDIARDGDSFFAEDRFHPSSSGYRRIAAALTPLVLDRLPGQLPQRCPGGRARAPDVAGRGPDAPVR